MALANSMRLSLKKGAHAALARGARQEIRVRFGPAARRGRRDDKGEGTGSIEIVCRTEAKWRDLRFYRPFLEMF